jgi:hypothetical protein
VRVVGRAIQRLHAGARLAMTTAPVEEADLPPFSNLRAVCAR